MPFEESFNSLQSSGISTLCIGSACLVPGRLSSGKSYSSTLCYIGKPSKQDNNPDGCLGDLKNTVSSLCSLEIEAKAQ